jgi:pimeloyl-ACP methyl ester carboxylesterase
MRAEEEMSMPYAQAQGAKIYYEDVGHGLPILFIHEFGADHREWRDQVQFFSREYRCITYAARGYPPSEVPTDPKLYGQDFAVADAVAVLRHLGIAKAHIVGLSMGGFAAILFGIRHPDMALSLVPAGAGSGSPKAHQAEFRRACAARGDLLIAQGWPGALAEETGHSPTRIQLKKKDPVGWAAYMQRLAEHSGVGTGLTMKHYQGERDSIFDWDAELRQMTVPTLLLVSAAVFALVGTQRKMVVVSGLSAYPPSFASHSACQFGSPLAATAAFSLAGSADMELKSFM